MTMTADDTTSAPQQDGHGETRYASKTHRERHPSLTKLQLAATDEGYSPQRQP